MIATVFILCVASLSGRESGPLSPVPGLRACLVFGANDLAVAPNSIRAIDENGPKSRLRGDVAKGEDDSDDDEPDQKAGLSSPYTPFGVTAIGVLHSWMPRHGVFRALGRSNVLRC